MAKEIAVGTIVTYVPGKGDFAARPKNTPMPAVVTSVGDKSYKDDKGKPQTIKVYNLNVHQDTDQCIARRLKVKHVSDAEKEEPHFTTEKSKA